MAKHSRMLDIRKNYGEPDYNSKTLWISDSKFELLPVQSPLLRQSLLISFPPLSNMLKSSGSSYLISGANKSSFLIFSSQINVTATESIYFIREFLLHLDSLFVSAHWNKYTGFPVPVAFKYPMIRGSAIHIAYRILAAFFIDMGAKTSIVENLRFYQP